MEVHFKNNIEVLQDPAIPCLGINLEKIKKNLRFLNFLKFFKQEPLQSWPHKVQQPSLGSKLIDEITDERIHNGVHTHNAIFLNHKEVGNNSKSSHREEGQGDHFK